MAGPEPRDDAPDSLVPHVHPAPRVGDRAPAARLSLADDGRMFRLIGDGQRDEAAEDSLVSSI